MKLQIEERCALAFGLMLMIFYGLLKICSTHTNDIHERYSEYIDSLYTRIDSLQFTIEHTDRRVIWLARVLYSETDYEHEMYYVGWVVRNRVELGFNGKSTYREVILDPYQFSAFNYNNPKRYKLLEKDFSTKDEKWLLAMKVARTIIFADETERPFESNVLYFYSESAGDSPEWRKRFVKVLNVPVDERRFKFYKTK